MSYKPNIEHKVEGNTSTVRYRVGELEADMAEMKEDIKQIMTNHLPHIEIELSGFSTKLTIFGGLILSAITALIIVGLSAL